MDREGGESLCCTLREADVGQSWSRRSRENVGNTIGNVVKGKLIDAEVPEAHGGWRMVNGLLRVLVPTVISKLSKH